MESNTKSKGGRPSRPGQVQVGIRMPEEAAGLLRELASARGLPIGDLVAMLVYAEAAKA